jgi:hypothetical protein
MTRNGLGRDEEHLAELAVLIELRHKAATAMKRH